MPRRPFLPKRYAVTLGDILSPPPPEPRSPSSIRERLAFTKGIVGGLLFRLERKDPRDAEVAQEAIRFCWESPFFWSKASSKGLEEVEQAVCSFVSFLSARDVAQGKKPHALILLSQYNALIEGMPSRGNSERRLSWLRQQYPSPTILLPGEGRKKGERRELEDVIKYTDAELAKLVLANRHGINQGEVHKTLAKATRLMKARRVAPRAPTAYSRIKNPRNPRR